MSAPTSSSERIAIARGFLQEVFGEALTLFPKGHILIWAKGLSPLFTRDVDDAARFGVGHALDECPTDVYVGVGLYDPSGPRSRGDNARGNAADVVCLPALWLDIDLSRGDGSHKKEGALPTIGDLDTIVGILKDVGFLRPVTVNSGNGMHVWQLLARALPPDSDIPNRLHHAVLARFEEHGWTLDNVSDPARVLRLPGTANYKSPNKPREVEVVSENVAYLIAEDVFGNLPAVPTPVVTAGEVGPLRLDAEAQPPAKLKELRKVDGGLARLWKQTAKIRRGGLIDPKVPVSPSEWDMALAHKLVALEFSDQEIVDTLIAYRREKFGDLKLRQSYYALTIGKARAASGKPAPPSSPAPVSTPALTPAPEPAQAAKRPKRTKKAQEPAATPDAPKAAEPVVVQPAPAQEAAAAEEGAAPDAAATAAIQTLQAIERAVRSSGKLRAPTEGERGIIRESLAELLGAQVLRVVCRRYEPAEYALEIELEEGPYTVTIGPVSALLTPMKVVAALVPHTRFVPPVLRATAWRSVASLLVGIAEDEAQGVTRSIQDQIEAVIEDYVGDLPYDSPCLKSDRKGAFRVDGVAYVRLPGVVDFARSMGVTVTWRDVAAALKAIDSHDTRVWVVRSWGPEDRQHSERYQVRAWRLPKQFDRKKEGGS